MAHRAAQIIDAAAAVIDANANLNATVEKHRSTSASIEDGELPLVVVNSGADSPDASGEQHNLIGSLLELRITAYVVSDTEAAAFASLAEIRRQVHIALMADTSLGIGSWVWALEYGGAEAPAYAVNNTSVAAQTSVWSVHYLMSLTDPQS